MATDVVGLWLRRRGIESVPRPPGCISTPKAALCFGFLGESFQEEKGDAEVRVDHLNGSIYLLALLKTRFLRTNDGLGAVGDLQLGEDVGDVVPYGLRAEGELPGDGGVGMSFGDEVEDLALAFGEGREGP